MILLIWDYFLVKHDNLKMSIRSIRSKPDKIQPSKSTRPHAFPAKFQLNTRTRNKSINISKLSIQVNENSFPSSPLLSIFRTQTGSKCKILTSKIVLFHITLSSFSLSHTHTLSTSKADSQPDRPLHIYVFSSTGDFPGRRALEMERGPEGSGQGGAGQRSMA